MTKLRQLQLLEKDILDYFVAICNENNLDYWLDFGTLLGAIRHKGFIPLFLVYLKIKMKFTLILGAAFVQILKLI